MAKVVSFPLALGRRDSIDPKFAPMGVLGICKNLRVRKDGRLVSRNGYEALNMTSAGTLIAHDLLDYQGRLVAFGADRGELYPTHKFEYTGIPLTNVRWRKEATALELTPFVGLKELTIMPPPAAGTDQADCATGAGYVCTVVRSNETIPDVLMTVVRESDNQPILTTSIFTAGAANNCRVTFSVDTFYVASQRADNSVDIFSYRPGTDITVQTLISQALNANATAAVIEIVPVENPTTARFLLLRDRGTTATSLIRAYNSVGVQVGSDITYGAAGDDTISLAAACDQTANVIHVVNVYATNAAELRTYNFSGSLLLGPTATTSGTHAAICRIPAAAAGGSAIQVAVATATTGGNTVTQFWTEAAHALTETKTVSCAVITTRVIPWTATTTASTAFRYAVVFGAYVAPVIGSTTDATNALFFVGGFGFHMATRDYLNSTPRTLRNVGLQLDSSTGRVAWCALRDSGTGSAQIVVTTFAKHSTARRQTARFGRLLYIAGAPMQVYDGVFLTEPFQETPGIVSATPSNGAGTMTSLATYSYVIHWEVTLADGSLWQSPPSLPISVTMGAADDTVTLVCGTPHHSAIALGNSSYGAEIVVVVSRTVFADGLTGSVYRRAVVDNAPTGIANYGATLSIVDTVPDATLATREALYTQSERGNLSGVLEHNGPRASQFVAASESRLYMAGQLSDNQFQASKESFLGEPFTFSEFSTFFGQVAGAVRGLFSLDGSRLLFTADDIFAVSGGGPDDLGGGSLLPPVRIPTPSGLEDWRSFLEAPEGLYFQLDDGKLYQLPRGGSSPVWAGVDIQDTLASYPVITGACKSRRDDCVLFSCQNTSAGTDGRIVVRSLRTGLWSEDTPPLTASEGIEAITAYGDSVAYATGGAVYVQSTTGYADGTSTVIPCVWKTQPLYPFGLGGTGLIHDLLAVGEYLSAGTLALRVSYDDGVSFTALNSYALTGLSVGQTIRRKWALPQVGARSLIAEWTFTPSSAGAGFILLNAALLVTQDEGLPELLPAEAA